MGFPGTGKIWMNGSFVNWNDAKIHIAAHVVHYGSAVFEGARCYATPRGSACFRLDAHMRRLYDSARIYRMTPEIDEKAWKKVMKDGALPLLSEALEALRGADSFDPPELETALGRILAEREVKPAKLYQPIRVAITGTSVSPGIFESLSVLGRERSLERLERAVQRLSAQG